MLTHKQLRTKALGNADVKAEYDKLGDEFAMLDEFLKAREVRLNKYFRYQLSNSVQEEPALFSSFVSGGVVR